MKIVAIILSISALVCLIAAGFALEGCSQPQVVKADTGEIVDEGNQLKSKEYDLPNTDYDLRVIEYFKGGVHYLLFSRGPDNIAVVNYTLDSLEVAFHVEHLDKASEEGFEEDEQNLVRSTKNTHSWSSH